MSEPDGRPIGSALYDRNPQRYDLAGLRSSRVRQPCPVCQHPTGDCTSEDHIMRAGGRTAGPGDAGPVVASNAEGPARVAVQGAMPTADEARARSVGFYGEPGATGTEYVTVEDEVLETVVLPGGVESHRIKYHRGQIVEKGAYAAAKKAAPTDPPQRVNASAEDKGAFDAASEQAKSAAGRTTTKQARAGENK